jgi:hypothetical protein
LKRLTSDIQATLLLGTLIVYGVYSTPTPDTITTAEVAIALLLSGIFGPSISQALAPHGATLKYSPAIIRLTGIFLILIPSATAIASSNNLSNYIRDLIPLIYLFIPLLILPLALRNPTLWLNVIVGGLAIIAIAFTYRHFQVSEASFSEIGHRYISGGKDYFPLDPSIVFTATLFLTAGASLILRASSLSAILKGSAVVIVGFLPMTTLIGVVARGPLALVLASLAFVAVASFFRHPGRSFLMLSITLVVTLAMFSDIVAGVFSSTIELAIRKSEAVGINSRDLEIKAVIENADTLPMIFFGEGWGGLLQNPIGGGAQWSFVHNSFAYFFFKSGIIGLAAWIAYVVWLSKCSAAAYRRLNYLFTPYFLAVANTAVLNFFVQASFKSLTIGLVLAIPLLLLRVAEISPEFRRRKFQPNPYILNEKVNYRRVARSTTD